MTQLRCKYTPLTRFLVLVVLLAVVGVPLLGAPALTLASSPEPAPTYGNGNHIVLGSRESGLYLEYTLTGAELGDRQSDGAVSGTLTSTVVTVSGTMYNSLGADLYTRPSMEAKLGGSTQTPPENVVSWPPPEMRDAEGYVRGPFEHEESFGFTYQLQPGDAYVYFTIWVGKVNGASDGFGVGAWAYVDPDNPPVAPAPAAAPSPATRPAPAAGKPPCDIPLYFYPGQDLSKFYTGVPSLRYTQDELVNDLLSGLQRYAAGQGAKLTDGALPWDVANIAMTFTSDSTLDDGKKVAPALQDAARDMAHGRQASDPNYRVSPGDLLELSLKLNGGNVRGALITCHAALYRDGDGVNNGFVEKEGILAPLRNPEGYANTKWTYTTPKGSKRTINPSAMAKDEQGPWYHLYGMAALEFTDGYGAASYYGAQAGIRAIGDTSKRDALQKVRDKGFPITGLGGVLGDLANALEEGIRSQAGKPPDVDKNCINYWGLKAGHELRRLVNSPELVLPPPDAWTPTGNIRQDTNRAFPLGHGKEAVMRSPLSLRVEGTNGEWFSFDQATKRFDGNTPLMVFDFFPEDDGTVGLVALPLFEVSAMQMTATGQGPVELAVYDPATRKAEAYQFTVQPGDQVYVPGQDEPALLNGSPLSPVATTRVGKPLPVVPLAAGAAGILLVCIAGAVMLVRRRSARARPVAPTPAPRSSRIQRAPQMVRTAPPLDAPSPAAGAGAPGACQGCGRPLKPGVKHCGACGTPVSDPPAPAVCPHCAGPVNPGARFCGSCGASLVVAPVAVAQPVADPVPTRRAPEGAAPPRRVAQPIAEETVGAWSQLGLRKGMLSVHEYNLVLTTRRLVFVRISSKMLEDAVRQAKQAARDEGKGMMGQWGAVIGARDYLRKRYLQMNAESILAEHPDSFFVPLEQVRQVRIKSDSDADDNVTDTLEVQTTSAKLRFTLAGGNAAGVRKELKQVLGDLIR